MYRSDAGRVKQPIVECGLERLETVNASTAADAYTVLSPTPKDSTDAQLLAIEQHLAKMRQAD